MKSKESVVTVSIIMATYNRAHFIEESIRSIERQSFDKWECFIIDDGSTDNTDEIIPNLIGVDPRFTYIKRPKTYKKGLPGCRNYGLDLARGEYIVFYDDDDIVHPENLRFCINHIKEKKYHFLRYNKQPFFGNSYSIVMEPIGNFKLTSFSKSEIEKMITGEIPFASCCVFWNKECFKNERFNENLMYAEEWECFTRILIHGYYGLSTDAVLYYNRKHSNSNTGEFQQNAPIRVKSQHNAAALIIKTLNSKKLFNENLKKYFVRMGFEIKSYSLIKLSLKAANVGVLEKWKYKIGYQIYPVLKPIFYFKGKL